MSGPPNVETLVVLRPIAVDTGGLDREGQLVLANGLLVGLLVRLDDPAHARMGHWFLEVALGPLLGSRPTPFADLETATRWLRLQPGSRTWCEISAARTFWRVVGRRLRLVR